MSYSPPVAAASFTLKDLLGLGSMSGARLLSGSRLDVPITRANVVEIANMADWAKAGECVISSGYLFRDREELLEEQLPQLQAAGAAVLCLKPLRFRQGLPDRFVQRAVELDFPLVELPMTAVFASIVQESMEEIFRRETQSFQRMQNKMELLLDAFMRSEDPETSLAALEKAISNPVLVFDSENELVSTQQSRELLGGLQEDVIRQLYKRANLPTLFFLREGKPVEIPVHFFDIGGHSGIRIIIPEYYTPLDHEDQRVIGRVSHILAAEMKNAIAVKKVRRKYKRQFVENWLFGRLGDAINICLSAQTDGYTVSVDRRYRAAIVNLNTPHNSDAFAEEDVSIIRHIIRNLNSNIMFTVLEGKLILVIEDGPTGDFSLQELSLLMEKLNYIMDKGDMSFCISDSYPVQDLPLAYQQARKISAISRKCGIRRQAITYETLGVLYLLALLPEDDAIQQYKDRFLRPLKEYDSAHRTALLDTLRIYLEQGCNTQKTAQLLHSHYNTVVYRIAQIERLLDLSISDVETQLQLRIAFKLDLIR